MPTKSKPNNTARRKAAHKAKLRKARLRQGKHLHKKPGGRLSST
jgi:hypothetical protein